jgi:predicted transposase YbfD/YdcC
LSLDFPPGTEAKRQRQLDVHRTVSKGHGRIETRTLHASSRLAGHYDWPGLKQVCRIERTVKKISDGSVSTEVSYAVTSLSPERASAADLLHYNRGHWAIENRLHWVRDVVFAEDASTARTGDIPENTATLRNAAISAIRLDKKTSKGIVANLRHFSQNPQNILKMLARLTL